MNIIELLNDQEKEMLIYRKLLKNETLFHENDECLCIGIIIDGLISIASFLDNGSEVIYNTLKKEQIFGNNLIFSSQPFYKGNISALKDSQIALIRKEDLLKILTNNEAFLREYLRIQSDFSKALNERIRLLSIPSAKERFLYYMYTHKNEIRIRSISALADELYLSRECVSRLLSTLQDQKKLIREDKVLRLL